MGNKQGKAKGASAAKNGGNATASAPAPAPVAADVASVSAAQSAAVSSEAAPAVVHGPIPANGLTHYLSIGLIQAKALIAADRGVIRSTSDPYVKVFVELANGKTLEFVSKIKKGTVNPVFNQRFDADCGTVPPVRIRFVVFDWDKVSSHDQIGEGSHAVTTGDWGLGRNVSVPLTSTKKDGSVVPGGTLQLQIAGRSVDPSTDAAARLKLDYVRAVGLLTLRMDDVHGLKPGPLAVKALGADVVERGAYDLRVVVQYGVKNYASKAVPLGRTGSASASASGEFNWESALEGKHVVDEGAVHVDQQCRIWVREGQESYMPRVSLYAVPHPEPADASATTTGTGKPSIRPTSASIKKMMRTLTHHASSSSSASSAPVPVLLGHGFLTTSVLSDGNTHSFHVYITEPHKKGEAVTDASSHDLGHVVSTPHVASASASGSESPGGAAGGAGALPAAASAGDEDSDEDEDADETTGLFAADGSGFRSGDEDHNTHAANANSVGGGAASSSPAPSSTGPRRALGLTRQVSTEAAATATATATGDAAAATATATTTTAVVAEHVSGLDAYIASQGAGTSSSSLPHVVGRIVIDGVFEGKDEVEGWFYAKLMSEFDGNASGTLDKTEMLAMLSTLGSTMTDAELNDLFARLDTSGDGQLDGAELLQWLHSPEFQALPMAYSLLAFLADGKKGLDELVNDVTRFVGSANKDTSAGAGILAIKDFDGSVKLADRGLKIIDRKTGLLMDEHIPGFVGTAINLMYHSTVGSMLTNTGAVRRVLLTMSQKEGAKMDHPSSASKIAHFIELHNLNTDEMAKAVHEFRTFNEFFYRELKPGARPIEALYEDGVAVSPADCRMVVYPTVLDATKIWVKGAAFTVESLLGPECADVAPLFLGGSLCIARLAPQDYHRWHLPVTGRLGRRHKIDGALYTVNPIAIRRPNPDVYTENKREVLLVHTKEFGLVAMVAVGATIVGSINIVLPDGSFGTKGDCHGYFAFGGSTVLVLFQPGTVRFDGDLLVNSEQPLETLVRVGEKIARAVSPLPAHVQGVLPDDDAGHIAHRSKAEAVATATVSAAAATGGGAAAATATATAVSTAAAVVAAEAAPVTTEAAAVVADSAPVVTAGAE